MQEKLEQLQKMAESTDDGSSSDPFGAGLIAGQRDAAQLALEIINNKNK